MEVSSWENDSMNGGFAGQPHLPNILAWRCRNHSATDSLWFVEPVGLSRGKHPQLCVFPLFFRGCTSMYIKLRNSTVSTDQLMINIPRSVFFHWKPLQKKGPSTLWITTLPWLQPEKGQPQLFLKFSSTCQRWLPSGFYLCTPTATGKNACISIFEDCVLGPFSRVNFQGWLLWGPSRIHLRDPCGSWLSPCSSGFWCDKSCPGYHRAYH